MPSRTSRRSPPDAATPEGPIAVHRYKPLSIAAELARMGGGGVLCLVIAFALPWGATLQYVLFPLAAFLLFFAGVMVLRGFSRIVLFDHGIGLDGPLTAALRWEDVTALRVIAFKAKRSPIGGRYEVTLKGDGRTIRFDSSVEDFLDLIDSVLDRLEPREIAYERHTREALDHLAIKRGESGL